jgi:hypothetical protein
LSLTVLIDARNVLRSRWPNIPEDELVRLIGEWAAEEGLEPEIVFDGRAPEGGIGTAGPYWLVTSDRELRERAGGGAQRVIGGGAFASLLVGDR